MSSICVVVTVLFIFLDNDVCNISTASEDGNRFPCTKRRVVC